MQLNGILSKRQIALATSLIFLVLLTTGFLIAKAKQKPPTTPSCPNPIDGIACKAGETPSVNKCTCYDPMKLNASCQCR
jgi:hypothetical protein